MERKELEKYQKKKVKITLKNGVFFSGFIQNINFTTLLLKDKFDCDVTLDISSISSINEVQQR